MKNLTKFLALLGVLALLAPQMVFAAAVTGVRASLQGTKDDSGYAVELESDRPWKVFEVTVTGAPTQVTDEDGLTPTTGVLNRVCVESAPAALAATDWTIVWDSSAATPTSATGRRLLPPIMRASQVEHCTEAVNLIFTRGLRVQTGGVGSSYIYWRELGAKR